jgi:hypothetical protein
MTKQEESNLQLLFVKSDKKMLLIKNENNPMREISPTSQLSQSSERRNPHSIKDIRKDEQSMLTL